jgi:RES domain-containing protein
MEFRMTKAWRIVKPHRQNVAFTGEGSAALPGRWHSVGIRIVYTSGSLSLAQLEMGRTLSRVHPEVLAHGHLPSQWVACELDIPDEIITSVNTSLLPSEWNRLDWRLITSTTTQQIGDDFILNGTSAVLRVPSAMSQSEFNYLLNPFHADFRKITVGPFQPFVFDLRLAT